MKKWISGSLIACTVLSTATVSFAKWEPVKIELPECITEWICSVNPQWKPECNLPEIEIPDIQAPDLNLPEIEVPETDLPENNVPEVEAPDVEIPEVEVPETEKPETNTPSTDTTYAYAQEVLNLVNQERASYGLSALTLDEDLNAVALAHSKDMADRNFFSHTNPDGKSPFDRMKAYGITYNTAGENIAAGQASPEQVVEGWMNSEGHRANILNASYTKMGLGFYETQGGYGTYWTQLFAG